MQRSSQVTGGASTNDNRIARAIGTSTACAQYRMAITSTAPANAIQGFSELNVSSCVDTNTTVEPERNPPVFNTEHR